MASNTKAITRARNNLFMSLNILQVFNGPAKMHTLQSRNGFAGVLEVHTQI